MGLKINSEKGGLHETTFTALGVISLCFIEVDLQGEEQPLAKKVDHIFVNSDKAHSLFKFFKDTLHRPEFWPFSERKVFSSGGLSLGNVILEFVSFAREGSAAIQTVESPVPGKKLGFS